MEPELDVELARLLGALDLPEKRRSEPDRWPESTDREGWHRALRSTDVDLRHEAALALADVSPPWLDDAVAGALSAPGSGPPPRPWLLVLARAPGKLLTDRRRDLPWAKVVGWARRSDLPTGDRCLALAALGSAGGTHAQSRIESELIDLLGDPRAAVRGCATMALGNLPGDFTRHILAMAHDPSAEVRVCATLALAALPAEEIEPSARAVLALAREQDPSGPARRAARFALLRIAKGRPAPRQPGWVMREVPSEAWIDPVAWVTVEVEAMQLSVPVHGDHDRRWAVIPGLGDARVSSHGLAPPRLAQGSDQ
jgi:hypothetical protein